MNPKSVLRRALCALAISSAVSLCAIAHEYEEMRIDVRTQAGVETVLVGAIAPGETKNTTTIAGSPARITRTQGGFTLIVGGEGFDIPMPQARKPVVDPADLPPGAKVMVLTHVAHASADGAATADTEFSEPAALADGQSVRVIRRLRKETSSGQ